ncbi:hypothetical protein LAZ67_X000763 [Cordylochernes scorpioides]|uniref:Uncharacterized protein n=1 Tax=Cordylochernes scorpioides TaxID=51811 RepID=A0ABY6LW51_9ARAC|nr:hypothetical protein LAZ67_X000763 [Cordylochernes scorpioides]
MKSNQRLFSILLQVTKLGFTLLIQKQNGDLLFGALRKNHLLLRKFAELKVKSGFIDIMKLEDRLELQSSAALYCILNVTLSISYERKNTSRVAEWTRHLPDRIELIVSRIQQNAFQQYLKKLSKADQEFNLEESMTMQDRTPQSKH